MSARSRRLRGHDEKAARCSQSVSQPAANSGTTKKCCSERRRGEPEPLVVPTRTCLMDPPQDGS
ncbi:Hypothetical predicted protein [Xyrichtys novacula]|uniref:Uncharacterized protein n=1 Tax=Xyrichtys novacula TaxID=13765 RepID=A0AAV1EJL9_XYRNO|nr:Hypothetical predicted protein [Xyrichtys novacula]